MQLLLNMLSGPLIYVYIISEMRVGWMRVFARVVRNISQQALSGDLGGDSGTFCFLQQCFCCGRHLNTVAATR